MKRILPILLFALLVFASKGELLDAMEAELNHSVKSFEGMEGAPLYYLQYEITDNQGTDISANLGAITTIRQSEKNRSIDVDMRVGTPQLDNTRKLDEFDYSRLFSRYDRRYFPVEDRSDVIRHHLWKLTNSEWHSAQEKLIKIKSKENINVEREDTSADFTSAPKVEFIDEYTPVMPDTSEWGQIMRRLSSHFIGHEHVLSSSVSLRVDNNEKYIVNTEGSRIYEFSPSVRISVYGATKADDGMEMYLSESYTGRAMSDLPSVEEIEADIEQMIEELSVLKDAPLVEPYSGPAILVNQASAVFFHEIFGHRIEGHRQKDPDFSQTFTKKVGEEILPTFISVYDDPTLKEYNGIPLNGHYKYDDEAVKAERIDIVKDGVLEGFLMSRSPIENFPVSNGHGRRSPGNETCSRMGNTIIESSNQVPFDELRNMLVDKCREEEKPFGLIIETISGGLTQTSRYTAQSFKVQPLKAWRVYTDGRPDELIRGVDIVGTPLTSFGKIMATADDPYVFNGMCGAESGMVPVSAVSPSILVSELEVEKKYKQKDKPPILDAPQWEEK